MLIGTRPRLAAVKDHEVNVNIKGEKLRVRSCKHLGFIEQVCNGLFQKLMAPPKEDMPFLLKNLGISRLQIAYEKIGKAKMSKKNWEFPVDPKDDK